MYELTFMMILIAAATFAFCWVVVSEIAATFRPLRRRAVGLSSMFFGTAAFCVVLALLRSEFFSYHLRGIVVFLIPVWVVLGVVAQIFLEDFRQQTAGLHGVWDWRRISLDGPMMCFATLGGFVGWLMVAELSWPLSLVLALVLVPLFSGLGIVGRIFWEDSRELNQATPWLTREDKPTFTPDMRIPSHQATKKKPRLRFSKPPRSRGSPVDSAGSRYNPYP